MRISSPENEDIFKVICTNYSFKTSILAKEERAIQIELNDYHDFKEFSVFLK